jgi:uncharacterized protein
LSPSLPKQERVQIPGPAGTLEAIIEFPNEAHAARAFMVVCHPHPQFGGTMENKVVTTLARCGQELAVPTLRFNYRGVGASSGSYDEGRGETEDALAAIAFGRQRWPDLPCWLAGFSFGGCMALKASARPEAGLVNKLVTIAPALGTHFQSPAAIQAPACPWLIVQGDADEVIDGKLVQSWAQQLLPAPTLVVLPGVGHFFHGQLTALRDQVVPFLQA